MDRRRILLIVAAVVAALGLALVFIYVKSADKRAQDDVALVPVLGVAQTINQGESIDEASANGKLTVLQVPQGQVLPGAVTSAAQLTGQMALTTLYPNEQVITSKFGTQQVASATSLQVPDNLLTTTVSLTDTQRVAGFINAGSHVAIYYVGADNNGDASTRLLLPDVIVVAVGSTGTISSQAAASTDPSAAGQTPAESLPRTLLTVAASPRNTEKLIQAAQQGQLFFSLFSGNDSPATPGPGVTTDELFG